METKGIEQMAKDELIELVGSLNKELECAKRDIEMYKGWKNREEEARILAEKKIVAAKAFFEVV